MEAEDNVTSHNRGQGKYFCIDLGVEVPISAMAADARMSRPRTFYETEVEDNILASAEAKVLKPRTILRGRCQGRDHHELGLYMAPSGK